MNDTARTRLDVALAAPQRAPSGIDYLNGLLEGRFPPPPIAATADIWPIEFGPGRAAFEGRPWERFYNPMGIVHGGWLATLLDTTMACAIQTTLAAGQSYATIEMKSVFVRPVKEASGTLRCDAVLLHAGRRVAHAQGKVYDASGRLVAYGSESCLIVEHAANDSVAD